MKIEIKSVVSRIVSLCFNQRTLSKGYHIWGCDLVTEKREINHLLHLVLVLLTAGAWLLVYIPLLFINSRRGKIKSSPVDKKISFRERAERNAERYEELTLGSLSSKNPGYKPGTGTFSSFSYTLNCSHVIRANNLGSINSKRGKTVYCSVCEKPRQIVCTANHVK